MKPIKTRMLILCALFAALNAILSQLAVPIGPVPINFVHASIFTAVGLLGIKYGTLSQVVFVLMGAAGLPVFSGLSGGIGVIMGPAGGFIISYVFCALIAGFVMERFGRSTKTLVLAMYSGWIVTYVLGVARFMYVTNTNLAAALPVVMLPFLPGDVLKVVVSVVLINRLYVVVRSEEL